MSNFKKLLRPIGDTSFLHNLNMSALILDVGCGDNYLSRVKRFLPDCNYTCIDVGQYNQHTSSLADH